LELVFFGLDLGFEVEIWEVGVQGLEFRVWGSGCRVGALRIRV
jgi:hypothetical protein